MDYGSFPPYAEYPDPPDELPNIMDYASSPEEHPTIMEHPVPSEQLPLTAEDANPPEEHSASTTNNWELDASELPPLPPSPVVPGGAPLDTPEQTADEYQPAEVPLPHDGTDLTAFWELGGTDSFPRPSNIAPIDCDWAQAGFETINCRGRKFFVPLTILHLSPAWVQVLTSLPRPPEGWAAHQVRPEIFSIFLQAAVSTCALEGTESGLNLCMIFSALWLAATWELPMVVERLQLTIYRYIVRRMLHRNPHRSDPDGVMNVGYFVFRSEELYRTWQFVRSVPNMKHHLSAAEIVQLYYMTIPEDIWPALGNEFEQEFVHYLRFIRSLRNISPALEFRDFFLKWFIQAGLVTNDWMSLEETTHFSYHMFIESGRLFNAFDQMVNQHLSGERQVVDDAVSTGVAPSSATDDPKDNPPKGILYGEFYGDAYESELLDLDEPFQYERILTSLPSPRPNQDTESGGVPLATEPVDDLYEAMDMDSSDPIPDASGGVSVVPEADEPENLEQPQPYVPITAVTAIRLWQEGVMAESD